MAPKGQHAQLAVRELTKRYGEITALNKLSLDIRAGELLALLGPSGCGKTTALHTIAGLLTPNSGEIRLNDRDLVNVPAHRRNFGFLFQSYALFPHMTVEENVAYGLRRRGIKGQKCKAIVGEYLDTVRLPELRHRYPSELSGGQQQRVALARALAIEPSVLLLDEPLSNLDTLLRDHMRVELRRLQKSLGITTILVTHDQTEALTMSDRICILKDGNMQQIGSGDEVYFRPSNSFVASFIARSNMFSGTIVAEKNGQLQVDIGLEQLLAVAADGNQTHTKHVNVIIRNSSIGLRPQGGDTGLKGLLLYSANAGPTRTFCVRLSGPNKDLELFGESAHGAADSERYEGQPVYLSVEPNHIILTDD